MASVQQNLGSDHKKGVHKIWLFGLRIPALVAEGSVSSDAAFEKSSRLLAIRCKLVILQSFTVLGTYACIQTVIEDVAGLVAHWL